MKDFLTSRVGTALAGAALIAAGALLPVDPVTKGALIATGVGFIGWGAKHPADAKPEAEKK